MKSKYVITKQIIPEGDLCELENEEEGICKNITECPQKLKETLEGKRNHRSRDHCNFVKEMEVVCCPVNQIGGIFLSRIADAGKYLEQIFHLFTNF